MHAFHHCSYSIKENKQSNKNKNLCMARFCFPSSLSPIILSLPLKLTVHLFRAAGWESIVEIIWGFSFRAHQTHTKTEAGKSTCGWTQTSASLFYLFQIHFDDTAWAPDLLDIWSDRSCPALCWPSTLSYWCFPVRNQILCTSSKMENIAQCRQEVIVSLSSQ